MPRTVPSPLRFGRNRHLRHWTIHRAWQLFQRQQRENKDKELNRYGHRTRMIPFLICSRMIAFISGNRGFPQKQKFTS